jgi:hypothetical protein
MEQVPSVDPVGISQCAVKFAPNNAPNSPCTAHVKNFSLLLIAYELSHAKCAAHAVGKVHV